MKIIFANNKELEYIEALETSTFYDNANRRMLQFIVDKDAIALDELNAILSDSTNLTQLHLVNEEEGAENYYDNYEIKMELAMRPEVVMSMEDGTELKEDRIIFKLGKLTTIEKQLKVLGVL